MQERYSFVLMLMILLLSLLSACGGQSLPDGGGHDSDGAPTIASFSADPMTIAKGETSTLSWDVTDAESLSISPEVGMVTGSSTTVQPAQTTEYTLTATNVSGQDTATTTVTVTDEGGRGNDDLPSAPAVHNTIAYVKPNDETGDEIHFIEPDGTNDRLVWSTSQTGQSGVYGISSLAWRPDAREIAFASDHENACSIFESDIYSIRSDGRGYRRITNAPTCAELATYPTGTVIVKVDDQSGYFGPWFVYVQGASGVDTSVGGVVTFENVADLGEGVLQYTSAANGTYRSWGPPVDVQAGGTVRTTPLVITDAAIPELGADWPSWHASGSKLGYVLGLGNLNQIDADPGLLAIGDFLLPEAARTPTSKNHLIWGPTSDVADQFLYAVSVSEDFASDGIYLGVEDNATGGTQLVEASLVKSIAWLPDGSGFVYSVTESLLSETSSIYEYIFTSGEATQLADFSGEFVGQLSVSPNGKQIVFEIINSFGTKTDLWIMNRDGTGLERFVENARAPAWSR